MRAATLIYQHRTQSADERISESLSVAIAGVPTITSDSLTARRQHGIVGRRTAEVKVPAVWPRKRGVQRITMLVRLRELLSNLGTPLENALRAVSDTANYTNLETDVQEANVRTTLQRSNHWLKPTEVDALVEAYLAGADLSEVGRQFNVHRTTARRHLLQRRIPLRSAEPAVADHSAVWIARYESGLSTIKIAAEFDTYPNTIRRALRAAGVQMRLTSRR